MDRSRIEKRRNSAEYVQGLREFINFAFEHSSVSGEMICPCKQCGFLKWQSRDVIYDHLMCSPFPKGYTFWYYHGEVGETSTVVSTSTAPNVVQDNSVFEDPMREMITEAFGVNMHATNEGPHVSSEGSGEDEEVLPNITQEEHQYKDLYELGKDAAQPLYEGCTKYSKLSFLVKLYHIKCITKMTDKAMTMILELLGDAFEHAKIPSSFYEAKKTITKLGLEYEKIPACPNNCMLYWGEDAERETCKVCNTSKWKSRKKGVKTKVSSVGDFGKKKKFVVDDGAQKKFILKSVGKKWSDARSYLFNNYYKWELAYEQNCQMVPKGITPDHWAIFLAHRVSQKSQEMSRRNAANREKQDIPHTLGRKSYARKKDEVEKDTHQSLSRFDMYPIAHQKSDGSFVNDKAKQKYEHLEKEVQETGSEREAYVRVFWKEHPGYIRGDTS